MQNEAESGSPARLTRDDVVAVVGGADPTIVSRIMSSGATRDDLRQARTWLDSDGASVPDDEADRERLRAPVELIATGRTLSGR